MQLVKKQYFGRFPPAGGPSFPFQSFLLRRKGKEKKYFHFNL